jgi:hypothetical protein
LHGDDSLLLRKCQSTRLATSAAHARLIVILVRPRILHEPNNLASEKRKQPACRVGIRRCSRVRQKRILLDDECHLTNNTLVRDASLELSDIAHHISVQRRKNGGRDAGQRRSRANMCRVRAMELRPDMIGGPLHSANLSGN